MSERRLPCNIDAEKGVLGSLIIDPAAFDLVSDRLWAVDFYRDDHRVIYAVISTLAAQHIPADLITLCAEMERQQLHVPPDYIAGLINEVPTSGNVEYYADLVARCAVNRRLIHAAGCIAATAYNQDDNAIETAERLLFDAQRTTGNRDFASAGEVVDGYLLGMEDEQMSAGVPTGFRNIDHYLGGMQPSDLLVVGARPSMGKSSLMLTVAYHAAILSEQRVAVFSLEMSKLQLIQRLLSFDSHVDLYRLRSPKLIHDYEWEKIMASRERLHTDRLMIDDTAGITLSSLRAKARRMQAAGGLDLILIDYLQLMHADPGTRDRNREQEIAQLSRGLKELAKELNVPVMALAQLSRAAEGRQDKRPIMSDLRESGSIENDADVIMFLYRDEYYHPDTAKPGATELIIGKHRNGPVGTVDLQFVSNETRFVEVER